MWNTIKEVAKNGLIMFTVGVALALIAPPLANMIGADALGAKAYQHAIETPMLWTGAFFGAFGAIHAAVAPAFQAIFGDKKEAASEPILSKTKEPERAPQINITVQPAPAAPSRENISYREIVEAQRTLAGSQQLVVT